MNKEIIDKNIYILFFIYIYLYVYMQRRYNIIINNLTIFGRELTGVWSKVARNTGTERNNIYIKYIYEKYNNYDKLTVSKSEVYIALIHTNSTLKTVKNYRNYR